MSQKPQPYNFINVKCPSLIFRHQYCSLQAIQKVSWRPIPRSLPAKNSCFIQSLPPCSDSIISSLFINARKRRNNRKFSRKSFRGWDYKVCNASFLQKATSKNIWSLVLNSSRESAKSVSSARLVQSWHMSLAARNATIRVKATAKI